MSNYDVLLQQLNKKERYIVGVSGGPDSLMLLHLLYTRGYELIVAHVNYHKRNDSVEDQEVVERAALTYNYPCEVLHIDSYTRENFQKQARELRYDFFSSLVKKYDAKGILVAHHQDDVLETILMQKKRKLEKVYLGIRSHSQYQSIDVYRPLLKYSKKDIIKYCEQHNIEYRMDSSNLENSYVRNRIRNTILSQYSTSQKEELLKEANLHNQELKKRNAYIEEIFNRCNKDGYLYFETIKKKDLPEVLYLFIKQYSSIPYDRISNEILLNCTNVVVSDKPNVQINLPVNHLFIKKYDNISISIKKTSSAYTFTFNSFEEFSCKYFKLARKGQDREGVVLKKEDYPITVRSFLPGDYMELSYGRKKVNRLFIDAKIPTEQRETWPILVNSQGSIILIPRIAKNKEYLMEKPSLFVVK